MTNKMLLHPVFDNKAFDTFEVFHVVGDQCQPGGLCCAADEKVVVLQWESGSLKPDLFLTKSINSYCEGDHPYFLQENIYECKVLCRFGAPIGTVTQLHNRNIRDIVLPFAGSFKFLCYRRIASQCENTNIGIKQISFHNVTSRVWALRAEYISSKISSVDRLSSHLPANDETQSLSDSNIDVLSNEISSNLTSSLRSFSFGQNRFISGDEVFTTDISIEQLFYPTAKLRIISETTK